MWSHNSIVTSAQNTKNYIFCLLEEIEETTEEAYLEPSDWRELDKQKVDKTR